MLIKDKNELRKYFTSIRNGFSEDYKNRSDKIIADSLFKTEEYLNAKCIFIYVSVRNEVNTSLIISNAFADKKQVAVPHCQNGIMSFYFINSACDLVATQFGVPTVDINNAVIAQATENTLCIVPALTFDNEGNRLGYGGGYYDRYLATNNLTAIGLCRDKSISADALPAEKFDVKINTIITEKSVYRRRGNIGK